MFSALQNKRKKFQFEQECVSRTGFINFFLLLLINRFGETMSIIVQHFFMFAVFHIFVQKIGEEIISFQKQKFNFKVDRFT